MALSVFNNASGLHARSGESSIDSLTDFYAAYPELSGFFSTKQPEINWNPDYELYLQRQKKRQLTEQLSDRLPKGWPTRIDGPQVWEWSHSLNTKDEAEDERWIVQLTLDNILEIEQALKHFKSTQPVPTPGYVNHDTFPLGDKTKALLRGCSRRLHNGNGLLVLRGLNPDRYYNEDNVILYAGITAYIGNKRVIQVRGSKEVLGHIVDTGTSLAPYPLASYTSEAQPFHSDLGDILCLYVLSTPNNGGESYVASAAKVYNEISATRPDLIKTMVQPWVFDAPGANPSHYIRPILLYHDGHITFNFARRLFTGYGANDGQSSYLPPISEAQAEALDAIEFTALKYTSVMTLKKGDIQLQHNLATIHAWSEGLYELRRVSFHRKAPTPAMDQR